jgi:hypothetical protein
VQPAGVHKRETNVTDRGELCAPGLDKARKLVADCFFELSGFSHHVPAPPPGTSFFKLGLLVFQESGAFVFWREILCTKA